MTEKAPLCRTCGRAHAYTAEHGWQARDDNGKLHAYDRRGMTEAEGTYRIGRPDNDGWVTFMGTAFVQCPRCKALALTENQDAHDAWHADLDDQLRDLWVAVNRGRVA